ncbi:MAG: 23S rRNA (uracil(1939)-C(5))-methyltransferase RlmD [Clostridiales bacterium]|jgi:23S rRNA (uracil1939-C5)-methyltransferase|nr:23S rRNA (uracil(1939)-C(5))-methyltransferase RlmD [Clostridiales bacterium]
MARALANIGIYGISGDGDGIGLLDGKKVFVRGALPGETAAVRLEKSRSSYLLGVAEQISEPSPERVAPACPVYGRCGGCSMMHMPYDMELECKRMKVADAFERVGGIKGARVYPVVRHAPAPGGARDIAQGGELGGTAAECATAGGAETECAPRYRNKAQLAFEHRHGSEPEIGYFEPRSHAIVGISDCALQKRAAAEAMQAMREWASAPGNGSRLISDVVVRTGERTGDAMAILVSLAPDVPGIGDLSRRLAAAVSGLKSVIVNANPQGRGADVAHCARSGSGRTRGAGETGNAGGACGAGETGGSQNSACVADGDLPPGGAGEAGSGQDCVCVAVGGQPPGGARRQGKRPRLGGSFATVWGDGHIYEQMCGCRFRISPASFFQVNTRMAELVYGEILSLAAPSRSDAVLDLYCGTGSISIFLARRAGNVVGVELSEDAVRDARFNARLNGAANARFIAGNAEAEARRLDAGGARFAAVVLDPPRKGCGAGAIESVLALAPPKILYLSCDPATMARDAAALLAGGMYRLECVQPFDMFPRTSSVEALALFCRVARNAARKMAP